MRKMLLCGLLLCFGVSAKAHAMAVYDGANHVENIISAIENAQQTMQQLQEYKKQLEQYQRQLQDAMNPGSWEWGDIQDALEQIRNGMGRIDGMSGSASSMDSYLDQFGDYDSYGEQTRLYGQQSPQLYVGEYQAQQFQKESTDELLILIKTQQEEMNGYSERLESLKNQASNAEGQQEAIQAGNELASMQIQLLSQIHGVLLSQSTMLAAISERENDDAARKKIGSQIQTGLSPTAKKIMDTPPRPYAEELGF